MTIAILKTQVKSKILSPNSDYRGVLTNSTNLSNGGFAYRHTLNSIKTKMKNSQRKKDKPLLLGVYLETRISTGEEDYNSVCLFGEDTHADTF